MIQPLTAAVMVLAVVLAATVVAAQTMVEGKVVLTEGLAKCLEMHAQIAFALVVAPDALTMEAAVTSA